MTEERIEEIQADVKDWPPIPPEETAKGTTLTPERLRELGAMKGDPGTAAWAFDLLALRDELVRRGRAAGNPISVRIFKSGLHINTDAEASEYHDRKAGHGVSQVFRQVAAMHQLVDVSKLSTAEQAKHDRALCIWGAKTAAIKRTTKALENTEGTERTG
jgi:hypothetical protein